MNARTLGVWIAGLAGIAAVGVTWKHARLAASGRTALEAIERNRAATAAQIGRTEKSLEELLRQQAELQAAVDKLKAGQPRVAEGRFAVTRPAQVATAPNHNQKRDDTILSEHRWQNMFLEVKRRDLTTSYGPFFRKAGLSPEEAARFIEIRMEHEAAGIDLLVTLRAEGLPTSDPAFAKLRLESQERMKAGQLTLLGADQFQELQRYERSVAMRQFVSDFAGEAALADVPLRFEQGDLMTEALANANERYRLGGTVGNTPLDWAAADAQMERILSESQLRVYRKFEPGRGGTKFADQIKKRLDQAIKEDREGRSEAAAAGK